MSLSFVSEVALDKLDNERGFDVPNIPNFKDEGTNNIHLLTLMFALQYVMDELQ